MLVVKGLVTVYSKYIPLVNCIVIYIGTAVLVADTLGKNLPAFLQHLAAFGGQMRIPRTITCSV